MLTVIFLSLYFSAIAVFYRSEETTGSGLESHSQLLPAARGGNQHRSVVRTQTQPGLPPHFISLSLCPHVLYPTGFCPSSSALWAWLSFWRAWKKCCTCWNAACGPKCVNLWWHSPVAAGHWEWLCVCVCVCVWLLLRNSEKGHISFL